MTFWTLAVKEYSKVKGLGRIFFIVILLLMVCRCGGGGSSSGGGSSNGSSTNSYQFLYDHNANLLGGYTIRWETNTVKIYTAGIPGAETAINRWGSTANFVFVSSPPSDGISFTVVNSSSYCGITNTYYLNSGKITQAVIQIASDQTYCRGGLANTVAHETAHALGFFGHTADSGLMDPDGGNGRITTAVQNFFSLLYSHPNGWNISSFLSSAKVPSGLYQPNGNQVRVRVDY
jgi:hypothetical protein